MLGSEIWSANQLDQPVESCKGNTEPFFLDEANLISIFSLLARDTVRAPGNHQERLLVPGGRSGQLGTGGENDPQSDLSSSPVSTASSQPWPELMNLREQSCLLFVCHFEAFWLIKICASMRG